MEVVCIGAINCLFRVAAREIFRDRIFLGHKLSYFVAAPVVENFFVVVVSRIH